MPERIYTVYILASRSLTLYIGVTSNLQRRVAQHKSHSFDGFSAQYKIDRLVYLERFDDIRNAISREKQLKRWRREKKIALIKSLNATWIDLSEEWGKPVQLRVPSVSTGQAPQLPAADDLAQDENAETRKSLVLPTEAASAPYSSLVIPTGARCSRAERRDLHFPSRKHIC